MRITRLRSVAFALGALALSAGTAFAFTAMPTASQPGLQNASEHAGKIVPVRATPNRENPVNPAAPTGDDTDADAPVADAPAADPADAPAPDEAKDNHGSVVSAVAKAEDTTPDTNHGADVSAVAKDNHGHADKDTRKPDHANKPDHPGKSADAGKPEHAGKP